MADQDSLHALAQDYMAALEAHETDAVDAATRAWLRAQERAMLEVQSLISKLEAARLAGVDITPAWLYQERRLGNLLDVILRETARWAPYASGTVRELADLAMAQGLSDAKALATEAAAIHLNGVAATFATINPDNLATIVSHLADGGPLRRLLLGFGLEAAEAAQTALIQGVMLGKGSDWITQQMHQALDIPRWRAETLARTEALRAYRETSRQVYQASNVVESWTWLAALDRRCCPACVMMHGTRHPVTETLDGHPRCRCAMVPRTVSWAQIDPSLAGLADTRPVIPLGSDWFRGQDPAYQRALLGPMKYDAWTTGEIELGDVVARVYSALWGTMRRERSMIEIRQGRNPNVLSESATIGA